MDVIAQKILLAFFLIVAVISDGVNGYATVSGSVFCDQCKDGQRSFSDFPVSGIKVTMSCADGSGQSTMSREETTNFLGGYTMRFDGSPDLTSCYVQVQPSGGNDGGCGAFPAGPPQRVWLMLSMFNLLVYAVDPLLSQPSRPMSFCPGTSPPTPAIRSISPPPPVAVKSPPPFKLPPLPPLPRLPPLPPLPRMPPLPSANAAACKHQDWTKPEYRCYWRALNPDTKVAVVFGPLAASRYGNDVTLWQALQGRGDPYRTLLREAIASLLNSYNSLQFPYSSISVVAHTNYALMGGSPRTILMTALRFIRANSGSGGVTCNFTRCK